MVRSSVSPGGTRRCRTRATSRTPPSRMRTRWWPRRIRCCTGRSLMASRVIMPKLTDSMEEGVVVKWRKAEGEHVESGDVLAEIETDKAVMDLEAFASGTLRKILVGEGTTVPSGALIGVIAEPAEDIQGLLKQAPEPAKK